MRPLANPEKSARPFVVPIKGYIPPRATLTFGFKVDGGPFVIERILADPQPLPWWWKLYAAWWFLNAVVDRFWCVLDQNRVPMPYEAPVPEDPLFFKGLKLDGVEQFTGLDFHTATIGGPSLSIFYATAQAVAYKFDTLQPGKDGAVTIHNPTKQIRKLQLVLAGTVASPGKTA